ncbi:hypothetical protein HD553DRAFT_72068 [Filobasidium floriforme]|uniref:uncharacterized protein n=1 Tax=Filobasidium floriforme TaxID=5210 RepID=UPI001E8CB4D1|nr:uncharacterized protein HD553DRAFT_72068 [Filobasidium floriforme]KAH8082370.1 hypothetical protein HD553DRAFT_72068 [Filobasidium floriforme]
MTSLSVIVLQLDSSEFAAIIERKPYGHERSGAFVVFVCHGLGSVVFVPCGLVLVFVFCALGCVEFEHSTTGIPASFANHDANLRVPDRSGVWKRKISKMSGLHSSVPHTTLGYESVLVWNHPARALHERSRYSIAERGWINPRCSKCSPAASRFDAAGGRKTISSMAPTFVERNRPRSHRTVRRTVAQSFG